MKKAIFLFLFFALGSVFVGQAQDYIRTYAGSIEVRIVLKSESAYAAFASQSGPVYHLSLESISMICYENEVFEGGGVTNTISGDGHIILLRDGEVITTTSSSSEIEIIDGTPEGQVTNTISNDGKIIVI